MNSAEFYASLFSIFLVGLLGNTHCLGMCGGISAAISYGTQKNLVYTLVAQLGRITTYSVLGFLFGFLAIGTQSQIGISLDWFLRGLTGIMLIALGAYLTGKWTFLSYLEQKGAKLWKSLQPFLRRLMPIDTLPKAFVVGGLWGFLPCGLVYSALTLSTLSNTPTQSALLMGAFGFGTLPFMLTTGALSVRLKSWVQKRKIRWGAGLVVGLFGVWTLLGQPLTHHLMFQGAHQSHHQHL